MKFHRLVSSEHLLSAICPLYLTSHTLYPLAYSQDDVLGLSKFLGALIILNGPSLDVHLLNLLWPLSRHGVKFPIICADGGANLLYDATERGTQTGRGDFSIRLERVPTCIVGDLDSVRLEVREWFEARGSNVLKEPSEDANDFEKAMRLTESIRNEYELPIVVIGGFGGRMDQTLGNLNTLICAAEKGRDVYWLDSTNVILALGEGRHHISIDASREGPVCALVPVGKAAESVHTEGLKWNLDGRRLSFGEGGLVSTSNEIVEPVVLVETSAPLVWTSQLRLA